MQCNAAVDLHLWTSSSANSSHAKYQREDRLFQT